MTFRNSLCLILFLSGTVLFAQKSLIQSGPMLGYVDYKEALVWVQTTEAATVQMEYWSTEAPNTKYRTPEVRTEAPTAFTSKHIADRVQPGTTYQYQLIVNGKVLKVDVPTEFSTQSTWAYRTDPPPFTLALGSCTYVNEPDLDRPGKPYGGDYQIFTHIADENPDLMLWLGDNTYFRPADWNTKTGMYHRHTHTRSLPEMQRLLATAHNYAIWDDHDFGPNDSDRSFIYKDWALEAFQNFWGNPSYGLDSEHPSGITTQFNYNDVDFFLLDDRYFRSPNDCETCTPELLGQRQVDWLVEALVSSKASFKMVAVGNQLLSNAAIFENFANRHAPERRYLLQRIAEENLKNIIFLTGDRHHTELSFAINDAGNAIYDLTCSPLTSGSGRGDDDEGNTHQIPETVVNQRNYGILAFTGPFKERKLTITIKDANGTELWTREIMRVE